MTSLSLLWYYPLRITHFLCSFFSVQGEQLFPIVRRKPFCVLKDLLRHTLLISLLSSDQITPHPSVFLQGFLFFLNFNYFH